MPFFTEYTDENLTTSIAVHLANKFTSNGWEIFWHASNVFSGTATNGTVSIVPEFPEDPILIVLPKDNQARQENEVILPAFSIQLSGEPEEQFRAGLGEDIFQSRATVMIDGYVVDKAQHLAFATMLRSWFRQDFNMSIYDFESNPTSPPLIDSDVQFENRVLSRIEDLSAPRPVRYYINLETEIVYYE